MTRRAGAESCTDWHGRRELEAALRRSKREVVLVVHALLLLLLLLLLVLLLPPCLRLRLSACRDEVE